MEKMDLKVIFVMIAITIVFMVFVVAVIYIPFVRYALYTILLSGLGLVLFYVFKTLAEYLIEKYKI